MKTALALLTLTALVLCALAASRGLFMEGVTRAGRTFVMMVPILGVAILLTGMAEVLLPKDLVEGWLSESAGPRGYLLAWVAGALTPAGGLMGMPLVAGLLKAGAGVGVLVTYLSSMALLPLLRVPMEIGIYGGRLAALRIVASCIAPPLIGALAQGIARALRG